MKNKRNNSKQQGPASDTRDRSHQQQQQKPTKHNNQQIKAIPGGGRQHHSWPNLCAGKQQAFWQLPRTTKTAAIAFRHFYTWKWRKEAKKGETVISAMKTQQSTTALDITCNKKPGKQETAKECTGNSPNRRPFSDGPHLFKKIKIMTWNRCQFFCSFCTFSVLFYTFLYVGIFRTKEKT